VGLVVTRVSLARFNPEEHPERRAPTRLTEPPARRLTVVILDGVGFQKARELPALAELRERGVFRPLRAHAPTFTAPNVVAMLTGRAPRDSRVRLNGVGVPDRPFETVLDVAVEAGWEVRCHARQFFAFQGVVGAPGGCVRGRLAFAFDVLVEPTPVGTFELIHVGEVDDAGHAEGPESVAYAERAAHADRVVARLAASLAPELDTLVVLSDHGHIPGGGHGGNEPEAHAAFFLAAFGPVDRGQELPERPMRDVASTLAELAGMRRAEHDHGAPMLDVFAPDRRPDATLGLARGRAALCAEWRTPDVACQEAGAPTEEELRALGARRDLDFEASEHEAARWRGVVAAALMVGFGSLARIITRRSSATLFAVCLTASNVAAYAAVLGAAGYRVTLSRVAGMDLFLPDAVGAGAAGLFVTGLVALFASRRGRAIDRALAASALLVLGGVLGLVIYVGANDRALAPSRAAALLFLGAPVFVSSAVAWAVGGGPLPPRASAG
jgi:hypothetical protein